MFYVFLQTSATAHLLDMEIFDICRPKYNDDTTRSILALCIPALPPIMTFLAPTLPIDDDDDNDDDDDYNGGSKI